MRILAISLCLFSFVCQALQPYDLLNEQETSYCAQKATEILDQSNFDFEKQSTLLNLLYHMYYFARIDAVYRKNLKLTIHMLQAAEKNNDPTISFNETLVTQLYSQTMVLARKKQLHGTTWHLLDATITEKHTELLPILEEIKEAGGNLVEAYAQRYSATLDDKIKHAKNTLNKTSQNELTISRTFNLIEEQPELFCGRSSMSGLEKIEMLYGLSDSIAKNIDHLSQLHESGREYAYHMQLVSAAFFKHCYQTLHDKISLDFPDNQLKIVVAQDGQLIIAKDAVKASEQR